VLIKINTNNIKGRAFIKNNRKAIHLFTARRLRSCIVFEYNNAGL
jgi:hypothetical protein